MVEASIGLWACAARLAPSRPGFVASVLLALVETAPWCISAAAENTLDAAAGPAVKGVSKQDSNLLVLKRQQRRLDGCVAMITKVGWRKWGYAIGFCPIS